jgi:hypothetical protein
LLSKHRKAIIGTAARLFAALAAALLASSAWAGMPDPAKFVEVWRLTDSGVRRYEAVSFFLLVLLLSAVAVRFLWNFLARDFPKLPRIGFRQSLGMVLVWGLLFLVVLTMIAGARELMTPGTWQKKGLLYSLPERTAAPKDAAEPRRTEAKP